MGTPAILLPVDNDGSIQEPLPISVENYRSIVDFVGGHFTTVVRVFNPSDTDGSADENEQPARVFGYVHDEGILLGLPLNKVASVVFGRDLYGPCVLIGADETGDDAELPVWFANSVFNGSLLNTVNLLDTTAVATARALKRLIVEGFFTRTEVDRLLDLLGADDTPEEINDFLHALIHAVIFYDQARTNGDIDDEEATQLKNELDEILEAFKTADTFKPTDDDIHKWLEGEAQ